MTDAIGARRVAGAVCCVCDRAASACVHDLHVELCGVVRIAPGKWICHRCACTVPAVWARAASRAL